MSIKIKPMAIKITNNFPKYLFLKITAISGKRIISTIPKNSCILKENAGLSLRNKNEKRDISYIFNKRYTFSL